MKAKTVKRFKDLRFLAGFDTQENFAEKLGEKRWNVAKWEAGEAYPRTEKLIEIAKILNTDIETIISSISYTKKYQIVSKIRSNQNANSNCSSNGSSNFYNTSSNRLFRHRIKQ